MRECPMADSGPLLVSDISRPFLGRLRVAPIRHYRYLIFIPFPGYLPRRWHLPCLLCSGFLQPGPHPLRQFEQQGRRCEITFNPLIVRKMDHYVLSSAVKSGLTVVRYSELVVKNGVLLLSMVIWINPFYFRMYYSH